MQKNPELVAEFARFAFSNRAVSSDELKAPFAKWQAQFVRVTVAARLSTAWHQIL